MQWGKPPCCMLMKCRGELHLVLVWHKATGTVTGEVKLSPEGLRQFLCGYVGMRTMVHLRSRALRVQKVCSQRGLGCVAIGVEENVNVVLQLTVSIREPMVHKRTDMKAGFSVAQSTAPSVPSTAWP